MDENSLSRDPIETTGVETHHHRPAEDELLKHVLLYFKNSKYSRTSHAFLEELSERRPSLVSNNVAEAQERPEHGPGVLVEWWGMFWDLFTSCRGQPAVLAETLAQLATRKMFLPDNRDSVEAEQVIERVAVDAADVNGMKLEDVSLLLTDASPRIEAGATQREHVLDVGSICEGWESPESSVGSMSWEACLLSPDHHDATAHIADNSHATHASCDAACCAGEFEWSDVDILPANVPPSEAVSLPACSPPCSAAEPPALTHEAPAVPLQSPSQQQQPNQAASPPWSTCCDHTDSPILDHRWTSALSAPHGGYGPVRVHSKHISAPHPCTSAHYPRGAHVVVPSLSSSSCSSRSLSTSPGASPSRMANMCDTPTSPPTQSQPLSPIEDQPSPNYFIHRRKKARGGARGKGHVSAPSAYTIFKRMSWKTILEQTPGADFREVNRRGGELWNSLDVEQKKPFFELASAERASTIARMSALKRAGGHITAHDKVWKRIRMCPETPIPAALRASMEAIVAQLRRPSASPAPHHLVHTLSPPLRAPPPSHHHSCRPQQCGTSPPAGPFLSRNESCVPPAPQRFIRNACLLRAPQPLAEDSRATAASDGGGAAVVSDEGITDWCGADIDLIDDFDPSSFLDADWPPLPTSPSLPSTTPTAAAT